MRPITVRTVTLLVATACLLLLLNLAVKQPGADRDASTPADPSSVSAPTFGLNEADVAFLAEMLEEGNESIAAAELVLGRTRRPEIEELAEGAILTLSEEMRELQRLQAAARFAQVGASPLPRPSTSELSRGSKSTALLPLRGPAFDHAFLELAIEQRRRAVDLATDVLGQGGDDRVALHARRILQLQRIELDVLERWRGAPPLAWQG